MTEEQKQALINRCRNRIAFYKAAGNTGTFDADTLQLTEIALAALTAQPDDWKQRAEAAEALNNHLELAVRKAEGVSESLRRRAEDAENKLLFTRPAPAADLAALVPPMKDDSIPGKNDSYIDMCDGWNACRAAILRKIEEAK